MTKINVVKRGIYVGLGILFVGLLFVVAFLGLQQPHACTIALPREQVDKSSFLDTHSPYDCMQLERADTPAARQLGLSGRDRLAPQHGMLFVFDQLSAACMWMKDMKFSLDMMWLDESGRITKIEKNVTPETYPQTFCGTNSKYVIEVNQGVVDRAGLKTGMKLQL